MGDTAGATGRGQVLAFGLLALAALGVAVALLLPRWLLPAPPSGGAPEGPPLLAGPVDLVLEQRDRQAIAAAVPIDLAIGDVTAGRVPAILHVDGAVVVERSFAAGEAQGFTWQDRAWSLRCTRLDHHLIGTDRAAFRLEPDAGVLDEEEQIRRLIASIRERPELRFVRNGSVHEAAEAAEHLAMKRQRAGERIRSAEDFIEQLASRSSLSGEAYRIRLPDGSEVESGVWLHERLRAIEQEAAEAAGPAAAAR